MTTLAVLPALGAGFVAIVDTALSTDAARTAAVSKTARLGPWRVVVFGDVGKLFHVRARQVFETARGIEALGLALDALPFKRSHLIVTDGFATWYYRQSVMTPLLPGTVHFFGSGAEIARYAFVGALRALVGGAGTGSEHDQLVAMRHAVHVAVEFDPSTAAPLETFVSNP